jgi:hypothetical protein
MSLIECTIERDGPTTINDGGFTFEFKENEAGHCVCDVLAEGVVTRLLAFSWFRKYKPVEDYPKAIEVVEPKEEPHDVIPNDEDILDMALDHGQTVDQCPDESAISDENKRILLLRKEGHSLRSIGSAVGRSPNYISKVIKNHVTDD